jgi:hypothetical protein
MDAPSTLSVANRLRRQAESCLRVALRTQNAEIARAMVELSEDLLRQADRLEGIELRLH